MAAMWGRSLAETARFCRCLSIKYGSTLAKRNINRLRVGSGIILCSSLISETKSKEEKFKPPDPSTLTQSCLIRNASSQAVDASTTLLNQTTVALIETQLLYIQALKILVELLEQSVVILGNRMLEDSTWEAIIQARAEAATYKQQKEEFEYVFKSAEKMVASSSEAAYLSGAEYMSSVGSERLYAAQREVESVQRQAAHMEALLREVEVRTIQDTVKRKEEEEKRMEAKRMEAKRKLEEEGILNQKDANDLDSDNTSEPEVIYIDTNEN